MRGSRWSRSCAIVLMIAALAGCSTVPMKDRNAAGEVGGDAISTRVDSEIARYFLEDYLAGRRVDPQWDERIDRFLADLGGRSPTTEELAAIAEQTSVDFAALLFAHLESERHRASKATFLEQYRLVQQGRMNLEAATRRYKIILIPGLFYRSKPETKGDLREVRATLQQAGFEVVSVPVREAGSVEENARIIADFVRSEPANDKQFILVSTSKGGADTSYALGSLMEPETTRKIAVWFSVGGMLRGSALADQWLRWPQRWAIAAAGVFAGFTLEAVRSVSVAASLERMEQTRIPPQVCVVHYVGVPLSGTVIDEVRSNYRALRSYGPNDGITLLPDEILAGATVITALGLDHWYRDPDLKRKMLALVSTVTQESELARCRASMTDAIDLATIVGDAMRAGR